MKKENKAFTLVELIVVITILAILATIGFVSFSGYLAGTRDTNRIAQLKSMSDALELYRTKKDLPIPDDKVDVKSNGSVIAYQGYIGKNVLETIEYTESGLDPKDKTYFSYYLTKNKKYFQLLAFLEEENKDVVAIKPHPNPLLKREGIIGKSFATDYSERYPKTTGKKLGILTDLNNTPIQEVSAVTNSGYLDFVNTNDYYNIYFSGESKLSGTGKVLRGAVGGHGLVGYWSFDEIENNTFIDYSENSATGVISGGVTLGTGKSGKSAVFNGTDGEFYVDLIKNVGGNSSAPHTISAWIKPNNIPSCSDNSCRQWLLLLGNADLSNFGKTGPGTHHWLIGGKNGLTQFGIRNGQQKEPHLTAGIWQNITITFDGNQLNSYINGKISRKNSGETRNIEMNIKNSHLFLGKDIRPNESYYEGEIDELRIYNRALTKKEVELIYNLDK